MSHSRRRRLAPVTIALVIALLAGCRPAPRITPPRVETKEPTAEATIPAAEEQAPLSRTSAADDGDGRGDVQSSSLCDARRSELLRAGLVRSAQDALHGLPGATVYDIDLKIAQDLGSLRGHQGVCYTNQESEPLAEVVFRLFPNLLGGAATVSEVQVDGEAVEPTLELADSALWVPLADQLQPGQSVVIGMDFQVDVAQEMASSYGLFGLFDGVLSLHEVYPAIPVYDDEGWNVELPPRRGDITFYDAAFYTVQVTAPARLVVVASGVEVARAEDNDRQTLTFAAGPARGFYLTAGEEYVVVSETVGETTVNSYALVGQESGADLALQFATSALESYNERFGAYPYTELDVVSTPMMALGMEYPGIVAVTNDLYDPDGEIRGVPAPMMMEGTVSHEVAHQWFYNVVGNDQIDEPWLDEALVQYVTGLYYLDTYGEPGYQGWRGSWVDRWNRVDQAEIPIGLPVRAYEDGAYGAIVYGRGPLFIEALAKSMGQETFDAFLRDYYQSHAWDIGTGEAFRTLAEQHCQSDLSSLFQHFVYGESDAVGPSSLGSDTDIRDATGWAVLAEKDDYNDVDMTDLPVDYVGIRQMRQMLQEAGWAPEQIRDVREFDRRTLVQSLDWLEDNAAEDDLVLVYVAAHGRYLRDVLVWDVFFPDEWEQLPSQRRVLVVDACQAANYTGAVADDSSPYLAVAAVDGDEYGWSGLEEEGLPIIGGVFTHYFAAAFGDPEADGDGDGCVSVQEAALLAEEEQRTYMHEVVFAVPEFLAMYQRGESAPDQDPTFPDVIVDDAIGEPVCLDLN